MYKYAQIFEKYYKMRRMEPDGIPFGSKSNRKIVTTTRFRLISQATEICICSPDWKNSCDQSAVREAN